MSEIKQNQFIPCSCAILDPENEVYTVTDEYVFATEEERPPFGVKSHMIHSKCKNPVSSEYLEDWVKKGVYITAEKAFFLK